MSVLVHLAACDLREFVLQLQHVLRDIHEQPRRSHAPLRLFLRQYLYFCPSKASNLSTCGLGAEDARLKVCSVAPLKAELCAAVWGGGAPFASVFVLLYKQSK